MATLTCEEVRLYNYLEKNSSRNVYIMAEAVGVSPVVLVDEVLQGLIRKRPLMFTMRPPGYFALC